MYEMDEKCRWCKNNGTAVCNRCDMYYDEFDPIDKPPITNADRIRAMTDEELVKHLACQWKECKNMDVECDKCPLDWLKEEAT